MDFQICQDRTTSILVENLETNIFGLVKFRKFKNLAKVTFEILIIFRYLKTTLIFEISSFFLENQWMAKQTCNRCGKQVYPTDKVGPLKDSTFFHQGTIFTLIFKNYQILSCCQTCPNVCLLLRIYLHLQAVSNATFVEPGWRWKPTATIGMTSMIRWILASSKNGFLYKGRTLVKPVYDCINGR